MFCAAVLAGCLWMAGWQWHVATAPTPAGVEVSVWRNYAYAVNWMIFAVVGVWFWWRLPRDQMRTEEAEGAEAEVEGVTVVEPANAEHPSGKSSARPAPQPTSADVGFDRSPRTTVVGDAVEDSPAAVQSTRPNVQPADATAPVSRQQRFDPFGN